MNAQLLFRSVSVLVLLFGLAFAVGMAVVYATGLPVWAAVAFAVGLGLLQYAIGPYIVQWIYRIEWTEPETVDTALAAFIDHACRQANIPVPRFGVIHDGNPNAFTFGHYPGDARLAVTTGLLDICDENERQAVVAHELGHIAHWDFVVMTVAATVPLVLYAVYRVTHRTRGRGRSGGAIALVGIGALIAYWISHYLVLFLSRVREYYADRFSAQRTGRPNDLATALVKIAYGLAAAPKRIKAEEPEQERAPVRLVHADAARALGIFDSSTAGAMALASGAQGPGAGTPATAVNAMKWDVWNPWGAFFELGSSHPLPAKRLKQLDLTAEELGQTPAYDFPTDPPESFWDEFLADLLVYLYPLIGLLAGAGIAFGGGAFTGAGPLSPVAGVGGILLLTGLGFLLRLKLSHPTGEFPEARVADLVQEIKVSKVRPVPCRLEGKVIGRGIPGLFWSEDLVLHDGTGFILLDYRQPLGFLETLFGWLKAEQFVGQQVAVEGWFRRTGRPFLEMWHLVPEDGGRQTCWVYAWSLALSGALAGIGLILLLAGLAGV